MWLEEPRDLPGVAGHLKCYPVLGVEAAGEELDLLRRSLDPPRGADLAFLCDCHLAELEVVAARRADRALRKIRLRWRATSGRPSCGVLRAGYTFHLWKLACGRTFLTSTAGRWS